MRTNLTLLFLVIFSSHYTWSQDFRFGKVSVKELQEKQHPKDATADAAVLYREITSTFHYDQAKGFYLITDVFERVKIYTKNGFEWGTKEVSLHASGNSKDVLSRLRAVTYSIGDNGKIQEEKIRKDGIFDIDHNEYFSQKKFTMPDLKEGSVIEYRYSINSPFIGNIDEFRFQEEIPVNKVNIAFFHPDWFTFQNYHKGWIPFKIATDAKSSSLVYNQIANELRGKALSGPVQGARTTIQTVPYTEIINRVSMENVPALKIEAYAGNINNYSSGLKFELSYSQYPGGMVNTITSTWDAVTKNIYDSDAFGKELERTGYFKKEVDALIAGVSDPKEKTSKIFNFVKKNLTWNGIEGYYTREGVREAFKKGSGNVAEINLALIAMLQYAEINANPVLISTKNHGIPLFPTRNGFNFVVAGVVLGNEVTLLDATSKHSEMGVLQPKLLNWSGRLIRKDKTSDWVSLVPTGHATYDAMVAMQLSEDLKLSGNVKSRITGNYAFEYRDSYSKLSNVEQQKKLEKNWNTVDVSEVSFTNLNNVEQPVSLQYDFETSDMLDEIAGKLYFSPLSFLALQESPFKLDTRNYPIDFGYALKDRFIVTIDIPKGYVVESTPENVHMLLDKEMGHFRYLISEGGGKIQLSVELSINDAVIAAEDYGDVKRLYEMVVSKQAEKVVLVKA